MAAGLLAGLLVAAGSTRAIQSMLFDIGPLDPLTYGGAAAVLLASAMAVSLIPAWRAARVSPATALGLE